VKIINWNVGRPSKNKSGLIVKKLAEFDADLLILTETNTALIPSGDYYTLATSVLPVNHDGIIYKSNENRVSVYSRWPIVKVYKTYDEYTSLCLDINTPLGLLTVYATIIGVLNGKGPRFASDLQAQLLDFENLLPGKNCCIVGDYNIMFSGYAYPSHLARQILNDVFKKLDLSNLTAEINNCVDHIAISTQYVKGLSAKIETWNPDKTLSDHIGICVQLVRE
jgi:hypothetical protein